MKINKALKVRIYPNKTQIELFHKNFGSSRFVYNKILSRLNDLYKRYHGQYKLNIKLINSLLNQIKKEYNFLTEVESTSLQQASRDLMNAYNLFFKNPVTNFPKFKSKKYSKNSFRQTISNNGLVQDKHLRLRKYGTIRYRTSEEYYELLNSEDIKINNVTISYENGKYYASINVDYDNFKEFKLTNKNVGFDVNSNRYGVLVDNYGNKVKFDIDHENQMIKKLNRMLSRCQTGSRNFNSIQKRLQKYCDKRKNKLNDFCHKLSHGFVKEYDTVVFEKGCVNILKNLCKSEQNIQFPLGRFIEMLKYKYGWYKPDGEVVFVNPQYTSRQCSFCGGLNDGLKINDRSWVCSHCGVVLDCDVNAAQNILNRWDDGDSLSVS